MVRGAAAIALGSSGPNAKLVIPALIVALGDERYSVRTTVLGTLAHLGPVSEEAIPMITQALHDKHPKVRLWAAYALSKMGPKAVATLPALKKVSRNDADPKVRAQAKSSIARIEKAKVQQ